VTLPARSVLIGTLSKAAGSQGGFAAAQADVTDLLVNRARSFIYTTGLAVPAAAAGLAALDLFAEGNRRARLAQVISRVRAGLRDIAPTVPDGATPIVPVVVGEVGRTVALAEALFERGIFAPAVRPPTVPEGTARLRLSLSAEHTDNDVDGLLRAMRDASTATGFSLDRRTR
jgi:8-amino-7-oxononanoate synthase